MNSDTSNNLFHNDREQAEASKFLGFTAEEQEVVAKKNMNLVREQAHIYRRRYPRIEYEELEGYGFIGYTKAIQKFNKLLGLKFSTFATHCIKNEILTYLHRESEKNSMLVSMESVLKNQDGDDFTLGDTFNSEEYLGVNVETRLMMNEDMRLVSEAINKLHPREKFIIEHRNGLNGCTPKTQEELAAALNRTQPGIHKAEMRAYERLKEMLKDKIKLEESSYYNGGRTEAIRYVTN